MKVIGSFVAIPLIIFAFFHPPVGEKESAKKIESKQHIVKSKPFDEVTLIKKENALFNRIRAKREREIQNIVIWVSHIKVKKVHHKTPKGSITKHRSGGGTGVTYSHGYKCWRGCIVPVRPCAIPQYICNRESRFIDVQNPTSSACGKYQFVRGTWNNFMGYPNACLAPEAVQDKKAALIWNNGAGASHWRCC